MKPASDEPIFKNEKQVRFIRSAEGNQGNSSRQPKQFNSISGIVMNWSAGLNYNVFSWRIGVSDKTKKSPGNNKIAEDFKNNI